MIIQPKVRGFICTTAHPTGCSQSVAEQINYVKKNPSIRGPKNVLIIGASTGYGLASRIVSTFALGANTLGVSYERPAAEKRTATAGWYNTAAFETLAQKEGYFAKSINGDAFSFNVKNQTANLIRECNQKIDLLVYSIASPRRVDPISGQIFQSTLKPIGKEFTSKTVDPFTGEVKHVTLNPATQEEIEATEKVMGGEDWELWVNFLLKEDLLASGFKTIAYSYIGPEVTYPIYKDGTIGKAKEHLVQTSYTLTKQLEAIHGSALISVNKALVTQASAAIPVVPLYMALLLKVMQKKVIDEGCIEQIYRLFADHLYPKETIKAERRGVIRIDDFEMRQDIQEEVKALWHQVTSENIHSLGDLVSYQNEFLRLFGFGLMNVNYQEDVNPNILIPSIPFHETIG